MTHTSFSQATWKVLGIVVDLYTVKRNLKIC